MAMSIRNLSCPIWSENASSLDDRIGHRKMPTKGFLETYLKIRCKACQCKIVGVVRNWEILLTAKEISGRIIVRYCKGPTIFRNLVALSSSNSYTFMCKKSSLCSISVEAGFRFDKFSSFIKLAMYCCCERNRPPSILFTWIPKKYSKVPKFFIKNSFCSSWTMCEVKFGEDNVMMISSKYTRK